MRRILSTLAALLTGLAFSGGAGAAAESFPTRPVRIVVPYAAGGGPDIQARQFAEYYSKELGQSVVVENKVGAAGIVAAQYVAQAAPDGYTLLLGSNTHLIQKMLQPSASFDPLADFVAIGNLAASPTVLVVNADSPWKTFGDLLEAARREPGKLNYGSGGIGTSAHLAGATLQKLADMDVVHVPLRGSVEIMPSLLRGDIHYAFPVTGTGIPQVASGRLRALAVSSAQRMKQLPEVPTLRELTGEDLLVQESWFGLWAPTGTPEALLTILHAAMARALAHPELQAKLEASGGIPAPSASPAEFERFIESENARWAEIVRLSGARAE